MTEYETQETQVAIHTLDDPVRGRPPLEVHGENIASVSTRNPRYLGGPLPDRWNTLALYELAESGQWLLYRQGLSVIYHRGDTSCTTRAGQQSGEPATVDDLPDDAEPCPRCRPPAPEMLADDEPVRYETPRISVNQAATPAGIVERLESTWSRDTGTAVRVIKLSKPAAELVRLACQRSPRFAAGVAGLNLREDEAGRAPRRIA